MGAKKKQQQLRGGEKKSQFFLIVFFLFSFNDSLSMLRVKEGVCNES